MLIEYYYKNVYGNELIYIKDKEVALIIERLTKKKTIDNQDIINLQKLGLDMVEIIPPRN